LGALIGFAEASSRFFEKNRRKKLLLRWCREFRAPLAQINNVFLLLFVHKKKCFPFIKYKGGRL
jgi:hypothetical protein